MATDVQQLQRRSALANLLPGDMLDASSPGEQRPGKGLALCEVMPYQMLLLSAYQTAESDRAFQEATGLAPPSVGRERTDARVAWLWHGPGRLLRVAYDAGAVLDPADARACFGASHAVVDLSDARTVVRLSGEAARQTLAKGCTLDLRPTVFAAGCVALTALAHLAVVLHARDDDVIDIYWTRSYAQAGVEWLIKAGRGAGLTLTHQSTKS